MTKTETPLLVSGVLDPDASHTALLLPNGRVVTIPTALLLSEGKPYARLAERPEELPEKREVVGADQHPLPPPELRVQIFPVLEEQLLIEKRTVETGKVLLHKTVESTETTLDEPLAATTFGIERIPVDRVVEIAPAVRQDGFTTIYPVLEERLVLTKQLILKEELHVTRRETTMRETRTVTLRREHMEIERR